MGCTAGKDTAVIHVEYESIMTATIVKDTVIAFLPKTAIKKSDSNMQKETKFNVDPNENNIFTT